MLARLHAHIEMFVSLVMGLGVGVMSWVGTKHGGVERMLEAIVSIAGAFLARLFVEYVYPACWGAISLSTIIWMLPGASAPPLPPSFCTKS